MFSLDTICSVLLISIAFTTSPVELSYCERYFESGQTDNLTRPELCPQEIRCRFTENSILIQWKYQDRPSDSYDFVVEWRKRRTPSFTYLKPVIRKQNRSILNAFSSETNTTYIIRVSCRNIRNGQIHVRYRTYQNCPYKVNIQSTNDRDAGNDIMATNGMTFIYIGIGLAVTMLCIIGAIGLYFIRGKSTRATIPQAMNTSEVPILDDAADDTYNHLAVTHKEKGRPSIDSTYHHMAPNEPKRPVAEAEGASLSDQDTDRKFSNQYAEVCLLNSQQDEDGAARSSINGVMIQGAVTPQSGDSSQDEAQGSLGTNDDVCDVTSNADLYCNVGENILSDTDDCIKRHVAPNGDIYSDVN